MKKLLFALFGIGIVAGAAVGYYLWNKPHKNMSSTKAAYSIDAQSLFETYDADEAEANQKYLGKVIAVSGVVSQIVEGEKKTIVLATDNGVFGVKCELDPFSTVKFPEYKAGQQVTLKGECTGFLGDVVLVRCVPGD